MNPIPCTICKEEGHTAGKCPTLVDPLKQGFYTGGGAGGGGGGEEDESICVGEYFGGFYDSFGKLRGFYASWYRIFC